MASGTKINQSFVVNAGGTFCVLMHDVRRIDGTLATPAMIESITRTIRDTRTQQETVDPIDPATTLLNPPVDNPDLWNQTYNFKDDVPADKIPNRYRYTCQYTFQPAGAGADQQFKSREIDLEGD